MLWDSIYFHVLLLLLLHSWNITDASIVDFWALAIVAFDIKLEQTERWNCCNNWAKPVPHFLVTCCVLSLSLNVLIYLKKQTHHCAESLSSSLSYLTYYETYEIFFNLNAYSAVLIIIIVSDKFYFSPKFVVPFIQHHDRLPCFNFFCFWL